MYGNNNFMNYMQNGLKDFGVNMGAGDMQNQLQNSMNMFQQMYGQGINRLNPYDQMGQNAIPGYGNFTDQMGEKQRTFDPTKSVDDMMSHYQETPYAKFMKQQGLDAMNNGAAMSGQLGSGQNNINNAQLADTISNQFLQNYIGNVQGQQNYGMDMNKLMQSLLSGQVNTGMNAANSQNQFASNMGNNMNENYVNQGQAQGAGDASMFGGIGSLISGLGSLFGFF